MSPYSFEVAEDIINDSFGKLSLYSITYERNWVLTTSISYNYKIQKLGRNDKTILHTPSTP